MSYNLKRMYAEQVLLCLNTLVAMVASLLGFGPIALLFGVLAVSDLVGALAYALRASREDRDDA